MKKLILSLVVALALVMTCRADIAFNGGTYSNGVGSIIYNSGAGMWEAGSGTAAAWAGGGMDNGVFHMGFQNNGSGAELSGTVLTAGTQVTLDFTKATTDYINYIAMNADPLAGVSFVQQDNTHFSISLTIVNPVLSASGSCVCQVQQLIWGE